MEATRSNDLENKNRWLVTTMNINEWEKKDTTPNTLSTTEEPSYNTTSPVTLDKTQCFSRHRRQQQHHEEDPELFVDTDIQRLAKGTWYDVLRVADVLRVTGGIRMTQCAGCRMPGQMAL